jgi:hypothetical protein
MGFMATVTVSATRARASAFVYLSVIDWAMGSASAVSRAARSGSVAATAAAIRARASTFKYSLLIDWAMPQRRR